MFIRALTKISSLLFSLGCGVSRHTYRSPEFERNFVLLLIFKENFVLPSLCSYRFLPGFFFFFLPVTPCHPVWVWEIRMRRWQSAYDTRGKCIHTLNSALSFKLWRLFRVNPRTLVNVGSSWGARGGRVPGAWKIIWSSLPSWPRINPWFPSQS